jgi:UDP-2,4-diacetamido-2,4,6-trideoxy-beta-L-altropyranose hydrolase
MRIAIRVDASRSIGTGHLRRCLSLADALRAEEAEVLFVQRDLGLDLATTTQAYESIQLPAPRAPYLSHLNDPAHAHWAQVHWRRDAEETVVALRDWAPDWLVIDSYAFDERWHDFVRLSLGCRIVAVDDLGDRPLAAELIVDPNPAPDHAVKHGLSVGRHGRLLGGPRYALLATAYQQADRVVVDEEVRSIGIFMGGVDAVDATETAYRACRTQACFRGKIEIATTSGNPHLPVLRQTVANERETELQVDLANLATFFSRNDLQVGAGGGAAWERCCLGAPAVVAQCAANQKVVVEGLSREGAALTVDEVDLASLGLAIRRAILDVDLRRQLSSAARRLVDGLGASRIASVVCRGIEEPVENVFRGQRARQKDESRGRSIV